MPGRQTITATTSATKRLAFALVPQRRRDLLTLLGFALAYYLAHCIAFFFPDASHIIMLVWPAAGVGLAAFLLTPRRLWLGLTLVFYAVGIAADIRWAHRSLLTSAGYMTCNMVESIGCAAWILWRNQPFRKFNRTPEILALIVGALGLNALSSCIGAETSALTCGAAFLHSWQSWYVADGLGLFLVAPFLVVWSEVKDDLTGIEWKKFLEGVVFTTLWVLCSLLLLQTFETFAKFSFPPYILTGLLAWAAIRLGQRGVTLALMLLFIIAMLSPSIVNGPSPLHAQDPALADRLQELQLFLGFMAASGYLIAAVHTEHNRAREALRESAEFIRLTTDSISSQMCVLDSQGIILSVNKAWTDFGAAYSSQASHMGVGADYLAVCDAATGPAASIAHAFATAIRTVIAGTSQRFEMEYSCDLPGGPRWFIGHVHPFAQSTSHHVVITHEETTARKQPERRQALLSEVLQILNEPGDLSAMAHKILATIQHETGFDAVGIRLQQGDDFPYFAHQGFTPEFLDSENSLLACNARGDACRGADGQVNLECTCGLVLRSKTDLNQPPFTTRGSFWSNDTRPLLDLPADQDPRLHPRNRCIHAGFCSVALIPIRADRDSVGLLQLNDRRTGCFTPELIRFFEGLSDSIGITFSRKRAEQRVAQALAFSQTIVENSPIGILTYRADGACLSANAAAAAKVGGTVAQLLAQNFHQLESWRNSGLLEMAEEALRTKLPVKREIRTNTSFGKEAWYLTQFATFEAEHQTHLLVMLVDLSEQRKAQVQMQLLREELYHMDRVSRMGEMASSLAHELNQPLTGILGNAQAALLMLEADPPDGAELRAIQRDIVEDAKRAGEVIRRLRAFLRRDTSAREPVAMNALIADLLRFTRMDAALRDVAIDCQLAEQLPEIYGDRIQLQEVLINLIFNAAQAMTDQLLTRRRISIATQLASTTGVLVSVRDHGQGFQSAHLDKAFDPYFTTKVDGLGMGLRICRSIIEAHDGRIWAENHPEGGAVLSFLLPATDPQRKDQQSSLTDNQHSNRTAEHRTRNLES